ARKAFATTAAYDGAISTTLQQWAGETLPRNLHLNFRKVMDLRYGENPHQQAALYLDRAAEGRGLASARQLQGKDLSFNNLVDLDARSEEHTSELQSRFDLVCRLLLEKKIP